MSSLLIKKLFLCDNFFSILSVILFVWLYFCLFVSFLTSLLWTICPCYDRIFLKQPLRFLCINKKLCVGHGNYIRWYYSEYVAHTLMKIGLFRICYSSRSNQIKSKVLNKSNRKYYSYLRTYFWDTIQYKYHGATNPQKEPIKNGFSAQMWNWCNKSSTSNFANGWNSSDLGRQRSSPQKVDFVFL